MTYTAPTLPLDTYGEANIRLGKIEAEENVTILFAVESGSRAWGFPSPDSDNDVRFFYVRPLSQYVGLTERRDVIERKIDGVWDVNGWDLRKALGLLVKGNATVAEWLQSPLIYREHGTIPYKLRDLIKRHASVESTVRHYYGLTNTTFQRDIASRATASQLDDANRIGATIKGVTTIDYKHYLYAVRGALSISWAAKYSEIPPMTMPALMSHDIMPDAVRDQVNILLHVKATMGEFGTGPRLPDLDTFVEEQIFWVKSKGFDKVPVKSEFISEANSILLNALGLS